MQLEILPAAFAELQDAVAFLNNERLGLGDELLEAVQHILERLLQFPALGHVLPNTKAKGEFRRILVPQFRYALIYRLHGTSLQIIALAHTSRKPGYWLARA
jgi:plasmid stabilization system protein ParE